MSIDLSAPGLEKIQKMKKTFIILAASIAFVAIESGCSGKKSDAGAESEVVEAQNSQLGNLISSGNIKEMTAVADSMSLFVDDFTPQQTVQVLTAFISIHEDAAAKNERRRDLETMRKYVDVYDIALSVNPKDTRAAFAKAQRDSRGIDFDAVAIEFRDRLQQYDAAQVGSEQVVERNDSVKASVDSTSVETQEIPAVHRPAE